MPKLPKLIKSIFLAFFLLLIFHPSAQAAVEEDAGQVGFERAVSSSGYNKQSFDMQTVMDTVASLNSLILGCSAEECPPELSRGAVHDASGMIAGLYANPPASGIVYVASVLENFGLAKPAYAQGTGFNFLSPVLSLWRAFRNLAYIFFIIIFIAVGFAIMFRVKLSPQTVISIQSALPRIIIALILITFSYAIAGFLIDLLYVFLILFIQFLGSQGLVTNPTVLQDQYLSGGLPNLAGALFSGGFRAIDELSRVFFGTGITAISAIIGAIGGAIAAGPVGALFGLIGGALAPSLLALLLIAFAILYALVRIFFTLLISYISILALVIFGPLILLLDALPIGIGGARIWFMNLLANVLVFPVTAILLIIGTVLTSQSQAVNTPPLLVGATGQAAMALIGLGILLFTAQIVGKFKAAFQAMTVETGGVAQRAGDIITWGPRAGSEEAIRQMAWRGFREDRPFWRTVWTWGTQARRWSQPRP